MFSHRRAWTQHIENTNHPLSELFNGEESRRIQNPPLHNMGVQYRRLISKRMVRRVPIRTYP